MGSGRDGKKNGEWRRGVVGMKAIQERKKVDEGLRYAINHG
jgi:hypothetical protein